MKKNVLRGVNILFSSVIPLGQAPEKTEIWKQARSFGAECWHDLTSEVTHVVAAKVWSPVCRSRRKSKSLCVSLSIILIFTPLSFLRYCDIVAWNRQSHKGKTAQESEDRATRVALSFDRKMATTG